MHTYWIHSLRWCNSIAINTTTDVMYGANDTELFLSLCPTTLFCRIFCHLIFVSFCFSLVFSSILIIICSAVPSNWICTFVLRRTHITHVWRYFRPKAQKEIKQISNETHSIKLGVGLATSVPYFTLITHSNS